MSRFRNICRPALVSQWQTCIAPLKGRGQTLEVQWIPAPLPPLRRARPGQQQPSFLGEHWQHAHWVRQQRRLQSLVQVLSKGTLTPAKRQHSFDLWRSILSAQGFNASFRKYWNSRTLCFGRYSNKSFFRQAQLIYQNFKQEVKTLEDSLKRERLRLAKDTRLYGPCKIFQDVRRPMALPVTCSNVFNICGKRDRIDIDLPAKIGGSHSLVSESDMPLPPITIGQWYQAIRQKKSKTAVGPDGFDKQDPCYQVQ